jgi:DNA-binding LytR/AlgR family response regulator
VSSPTAIIAEDEPLQRSEIRDALAAQWPELQIKAEVGDGIQAIKALDLYAPNVAFLDIQMPGLSGLEVARHASGRSHVVFVTAFDQYALAAFEQGALDYILKPVEPARMAVMIARLRDRLREQPAHLDNLIELLRGAANEGPRYLKWLTVPKGSELHVVAVADIYYIRADNKYTVVATRGTTFLLNFSLKEMQEKLDPTTFWKIHRGIIVNVGAIDKIFRSFRGALEIKLRDRAELLPVSAAHAHLFKST